MLDRMKDLLAFFIAAMAMTSLLCAVYEAMNQRIWSSGALATIFVVAFLLFYFPQLDAVMAPAQAFGEGWWLSPV